MAITVHGADVRGPGNEILLAVPGRRDTELARAACEAIDRHFAGEAVDRRRPIPKGRVKASVTDGWVTLWGTVDWRPQRTAVERVVHDLPGVNGVTDLIQVPCMQAS